MENMINVVAEMRDRYPEAWRNAHTGNAQTEDFIRLLAWELHSKHDPRWGLNGKRGNPEDVSDDVVAWNGEGTARDKTRGFAPMEIIDCIGGAGGPNPTPAWNVGPGGPGDVGAWVQPDPVGGAQPQPGGNTGGTKPQPVPVLACRMTDDVLQVLGSLSTRLQNIEGAVGAINTRMDEDWAARVVLGIEDTKRQAEAIASAINAALGTGGAAPKYVARTKIFGQNIEIHFEPVA